VQEEGAGILKKHGDFLARPLEKNFQNLYVKMHMYGPLLEIERILIILNNCTFP
jgi:hypothetical protein